MQQNLQVSIEVVEGEPGQPVEEQAMSKDDASRYRAAAARLNFLAQDRPGLQHCSKECSRRMAIPRIVDSVTLKHVVNYLKGNPAGVSHGFRYLFGLGLGKMPRHQEVNLWWCVTAWRPSVGHLSEDAIADSTFQW